jgi:hypothetical protein
MDVDQQNDLLIVINRFYRGSVIDTASGRPGVETYLADCYYSWRRVDLEYHRELFKKLLKSSTEMPDEADVRPTNL